ncbi:pilus assembly FimT family protein [Hydrogenimonas urashimensis]|uniref:pilus assembly FimT family protein n=1 Tax=Hydrogenimonas urashimensis TaxID=2740515 RepID=UPI001916B9E7|nr:type II secretion system protein [Hydrogenimonas urashimensis]
MKHAFTMLELIAVIVIVAILSVVMIPRFSDDKLREVADQVISHIRYTQHLAMIDNKYDAQKSDWYKERWQIFFSKSSDSSLGNAWAYTIFSDAFTHTGKPDPTEVASDPENSGKKLTGGYTSGGSGIEYSDSRSTPSMNIERTYGIKDVVFQNCGNSAKRISFDNLGRPYYGDLSTSTDPYSRLIKNQCRIVLCETTCGSAANDEKVIIAIEPETGYVHML